jgi:hypothetical protein
MPTLANILRGAATRLPPGAPPKPPPPNTAQFTEAARRETICRTCPQWDCIKEGCFRFRKCERHKLTRVYWISMERNGCFLNKWTP